MKGSRESIVRATSRSEGKVSSPTVITPAAFSTIARWADVERLHLIIDGAQHRGVSCGAAMDAPTCAVRLAYQDRALAALEAERSLDSGPLVHGQAIPPLGAASPYGSGYIARAALAALAAERLDDLSALAVRMREAVRHSRGDADATASEWARRAEARWRARPA